MYLRAITDSSVMVDPKWGIGFFQRRKGVLQGMKPIKAFVFVFVALVLLLTGCAAKEESAVTGIRFNRGHGSAWGNQFYIELDAEQIVTASYIPEGTGELVTVNHIPITDAQWQSIIAAAQQLPLGKARTNPWENRKLDGGEFRELTLIRGKKETKYRWPDGPEAQQLEQLLETLLKDSVQPKIYDTGQFCALLPPGWTAFPVEDVFSDTPGAVKADRIHIIRGGTKVSDVKTNIYIILQYYGPGEPVEEPDPGGLQDTWTIAPFQTGEHLWYGFAGTDIQGRARLGTSAVLWTQEGEHGYVVAFPLEFNNQTLSLEDPELLAILASLSPSGTE